MSSGCRPPTSSRPAGWSCPRRASTPATALGHAAAISIGVRPTFEQEGRLLIEAHLLDFDGDLYGEALRVSFFERLRDELRFDSADALVEQMQQDVEAARAACLCYLLTP